MSESNALSWNQPMICKPLISPSSFSFFFGVMFLVDFFSPQNNWRNRHVKVIWDKRHFHPLYHSAWYIRCYHSITWYDSYIIPMYNVQYSSWIMLPTSVLNCALLVIFCHRKSTCQKSKSTFLPALNFWTVTQCAFKLKNSFPVFFK